MLEFSGDVAENLATLIAADYFLRPTLSSDDRMRNLSYAQNKLRTELQKILRMTTPFWPVWV